MARTPTVELIKEWFERAEDGDADGMAELLADDALFFADHIRGRRFTGRDEIQSFLTETGFEANGYSYTGIDDDYAVVTLSVRRHLPHGGLADSTLAMVFKVEDGEIVCMDAFPSEHEALASVARRG
jgi:ketosteroid isomerase-like protein